MPFWKIFCLSLLEAVPSVYVVVGLLPKYLKFKPGCFIFAAISIAIQPWNISSMDVVLNVFGATAAPVVAIVAVDYYIFRKRKFSLDDIYKTHGKYYYWNGFNPAAMIAYVIGTAVAVIFMDYGFFISLAVTPIIYYFLAKIFGKTYPAMVSETAADIVIA